MDIRDLSYTQSKKESYQELAKNNEKLKREIERYQQIEAQLRLMCDRYQAVVDSQPEMICRFLPDGTLTFVNLAYCRYFNQTSDMLIGCNFIDLIPENQQVTVLKQLAELRRLTPENSVIIQEYQILQEDGNLAWHQWTNYAIFDQHKRLVEVQAVGQDITNKKQLELTLRNNQDHLENILSSIEGVIWSMSTDFSTILYINPIAEQIYGRPVADFFANPNLWLEVIHAEDQPKVAAGISTLKFKSRFDFEYRILRPDGEIRWIQDRGYLICDQNGQPVRYDGIITDITKQKQQEEWLRLQSAALEACANGIVITDRQGNILWVNPAFTTLTGYTLAESINKNTRQLVNSSYHERAFFQNLWQKILTGKVWHGELVNRRKDGSLYIEEMTITPVHNDQGEITNFIAIKQDITERKQAEKTLQESEERFRTIFENAEIGIAICCPKTGQLTLVNRFFCELVGYSPEELLNKQFSTYTHPDDLPAEKLLIQECVAQLREGYQLEKRYLRKDGTIRWVNLIATVIREANGQIRSGFIIVKDITERKQVETALQRSEGKLRDIFNSAIAGIVSARVYCDRTWDYEYLSAGCEELFGYTVAELIANPMDWILQVYPDDLENLILPSFDIIFAEGSSQFEYRYYHKKNGNLRWILVHFTSRYDAISDCWMVTKVHIDITERKQAEYILQQQTERERFIAKITNHIRRSLNLPEILNTTVTEVRQFLQADRVLIYRFNSENSGSVIAESVGNGWMSTLGRIIDNKHLTKKDFFTFYIQEYLTNRDETYIGELNESYVNILSHLQVKANLVLAILHGEELWGLLIAHQCDEPRVWQTEEINLLQQLADQLAIAIQQAELYQQVQHLNTSLEFQVENRTAQLQQALDFEALLRRITDKVRDSLDEEQILQTAVEELAIVLDAMSCDTAFYNLEQETITVNYEFLNSDMVSVKRMTMAIAEMPDVHQQILQANYVHFCPIYQPLTVVREMKLQFSILACPLINETGVFGNLWLFRSQEIPFTTTEIRLVEQVASQCAIALRQSHLYQSVQEQVKELERLNQLKDDFLNTVSHELRSPMANIKMALQMLEIMFGRARVNPNMPPDSEVILRQTTFAKVQQYFQILNQESQREINLINDLLDLARLDAQTVPLTLTPITLQFWIPHIAEPFAQRIQQYEQELNIDIPQDIAPLFTDITSLERVITELLHNACKYTPPQGTISISARLTSSEKPEISSLTNVVITVSNSGIEIPPEEWERIFDKFYRIPNTDPWKHGGTGLGLALVKKLVKHLGGTIEVHSDNFQTSFIITFPLEPI
jgi:PAS domain S-box-containing protein